jgi:prolyl-tRNA synthetase
MRPADRFFHWVQQGVPVRVEIGPKDVEKGTAMFVRRDTREKIPLGLDAIAAEAPALLTRMQGDLYAKARQAREDNTHRVDSYAEFKRVLEERAGFLYAHWNGSAEVEALIKEETKATIRCIPLGGEPAPGKCMVTGEPSPRRVYFALAY